MASNTIALIVMRGSQEGQDWLRDVEALKTDISLAGDKLDTSAYYTHSGFYDYLTPIKEDIYFAIEEILENNISRNIYVAGHSLEGAAACLFSVFLSERPNIMSLTKQLRLFTYGEPRSLNEEAMLQKINRFVGRLEAQNRLISQDSRDNTELDYQYDTNRETIEWLEQANASSRLTSALVVFGDVDDSGSTLWDENMVKN